MIGKDDFIARKTIRQDHSLPVSCGSEGEKRHGEREAAESVQAFHVEIVRGFAETFHLY